MLKEFSPRFERAEVVYNSVNSNRFLLPSKNYVQQYNQVYLRRLAEMRVILRSYFFYSLQF
jgi:hypothetical protein